MKKIINPWKDKPGYNCFGCAQENPIGLKMEFYEDAEEIVSFWEPSINHQGWINTLHGGIQATILDEICAWVVIRKLQCFGVTSKMETRYLKSISTENNKLELRAKILERKRNIVIIEAKILDQEGNLCTSAICTYFCISEEKSRSEHGFQGCFVVE